MNKEERGICKEECEQRNGSMGESKYWLSKVIKRMNFEYYMKPSYGTTWKLLQKQKKL